MTTGITTTDVRGSDLGGWTFVQRPWPFTCGRCGQKFSSESFLKDHQKRHEDIEDEQQAWQRRRETEDFLESDEAQERWWDQEDGDWKAIVSGIMDEPKESILEEAQRIVHGPRQTQYGHPSTDFAATGRMWGSILTGAFGVKVADISPHTVALMMVALKLSRESRKPHRDNRVDGAGYLETADMVLDSMVLEDTDG